jgi:FdhE protein
MTEVALPDQDALELASAHAIPPISVASFKLPPAWRDVLRQFANDLLPDAPVGARDTLDSLLVTSTEELQRLGEMLLTGEPKSLEDMTRLPFIAAALQVVFTGLASQLDASKMPLMEARSVCPCCGSLPVVSVIRADGPAGNPRYAHCTLCNTEWNIPRATCVACGEEEKLALHEIDGDDGIARAESCEACHSYLKIIYQSKGAIVDPIADDLASVALDMLVDDAGFERSGPNLLLIGAGGDNVDLK